MKSSKYTIVEHQNLSLKSTQVTNLGSIDMSPKQKSNPMDGSSMHKKKTYFRNTAIEVKQI